MRENEIGRRHRERYDDERVNPGGLDGTKLADVRGLRVFKSIESKRYYFVVGALRVF